MVRLQLLVNRLKLALQLLMLIIQQFVLFRHIPKVPPQLILLSPQLLQLCFQVGNGPRG